MAIIVIGVFPTFAAHTRCRSQRLCFIRRVTWSKWLTQALRQLGELINVLARVSTVWDAEAKVKVEALQQVITEVVPFDHAEIIQGPIPNRKFYPVGKQRKELFFLRLLDGRGECVCWSYSRSSHGPQFKEGWRELVAHKAARAAVCVPVLFFILWGPAGGESTCSVRSVSQAEDIYWHWELRVRVRVILQ